MEYQIITDGSCDLERTLLEQHHVEVVPFYVSFDGTNYYKEVEEISIREFYEQMVKNPTIFPTTSLPSVQDYMNAFLPFVEQDMPVICICMTIKLSGSYNSAKNAKEELLENYPNAKITVIESTLDTVLQGLYVLEAIRMQQNKLSYEQAVSHLERIKSTGRILFTVGNMDYLIHGGRVGKVMGAAASTLGIKPLIMLREGEIFPTGITRNRKRGKEKLIAQTKEHFESIKENPDQYQIVVGYGYEKEEGYEFSEQLLHSLQSYSNQQSIEAFQIGATTAVHTGPYAIGLGLLKKYDV